MLAKGKSMLREVIKSDFDKLYEWVNDKEVRKNGYKQELVEKTEYYKWFVEKLGSPNAMMFIIEQDEKDVGELRIEKHKNDALIIYSIDKRHRWNGIGKKSIGLIESYYQMNKHMFKGIESFSAFVKANNIYSIKIFERNNFIRIYEDSKYIVFRKSLEA